MEKLNTAITYNGKDYRLKERNFELISKIKEMDLEKKDYIDEYIKEQEIALKKYDKKSPEYAYYLDKIDERKQLAEENYNIKNTFKLLGIMIDGDLNFSFDEINTDEFKQFMGDIEKYFFTLTKLQTKKSKK